MLGLLVWQRTIDQQTTGVKQHIDLAVAFADLVDNGVTASPSIGFYTVMVGCPACGLDRLDGT